MWAIRPASVGGALPFLQDDSLRSLRDSIPLHPYTILPDTTQLDTVPKDTTPQAKSALEYPVSYTAGDSITFDYSRSRANLFGKSHVEYSDFNLDADVIQIRIDSSLVHAHGSPDSTGKVQNKPVFTQGSDKYDPDKISYNFKTRKAFISNVYTKQGEGFMTSEDGKRDSSGVVYVRHGKYTTCDAKHPHFYIALSRAKMRPGKNVVFGPAHVVVEDVPLPLWIPYGFFPFRHSYQSGFIMPTFGDEMSRGFYLREGGYYFAFNDYVDARLMGEIYTKGSWGLSLQSTYKKRYKFSGNVFISFQSTILGEKNMPDYSKSNSFKITWSHRQDPKANPTQTFSASVNFATSSYERNNLTSMYNPESYTQSTRTSSIAYSKTFSKIGLTLASTVNMSQSMRDSSLSLTLPTLNISLNRFYPLKRKHMVGKERWYEKIALSYTGTLTNTVNTKENLLFKSNYLKTWRTAMRHQIPVSASFQILKYINVTPSFNFTDRMYTKKVTQSWDKDAYKVRRDTTYGFYNVYNFNMSVSANTKLYGMYRPLPWFGGKRIPAIRHVITPSVSFSYAPDFSTRSWGFYDSYVRTDKDGNVSTVTYSPFAGQPYGVPGQGMTGSVTMDVSNNLEMKWRTRNDSLKKISIIDELGASLSYNMAAKSKPWSDLNTRLRIKLGKSRTYSMNAVFATYAYEFDKNHNVIVGDHTEWSRGRFGRFQGMSQSFSQTFNNQTIQRLLHPREFFKKKKDQEADDFDFDEEEDDTDPEMQNVDPERKRARERKGEENEHDGEVDDDGYLRFSMPWNFTVSYSVTMREDRSAKINEKTMRYPYTFTHTLNFSGNLQIAKGWNINFSSGYDFNYHRLSMTTASLSRKLHCFSLSGSLVLYPYTSYNITFQADSSTLADVLRYKKQSSYSSNIEWY